MTARHSCEMRERHGRALTQLVRRVAGRGAPGAVALRDAPAFADVLSELGARVVAEQRRGGGDSSGVYLAAAADMLLLLRRPLVVAAGEMETARQAAVLQEGLVRLVGTVTALLEPLEAGEGETGAAAAAAAARLQLPPFRLVAAALAALGQMAATLERWPQVTSADALLATVARTSAERVEAMTASACVAAGLPAATVALLRSLFAPALATGSHSSSRRASAAPPAAIPGADGVAPASWHEAQLLALRLTHCLSLHRETARALVAVGVPRVLMACLAADQAVFDCLHAAGGLALETLWQLLDTAEPSGGANSANSANSAGSAGSAAGSTSHTASLSASLTQSGLRSLAAARNLRNLTLEVLRQPSCARHAVAYLRGAVMRAESVAERSARNDALALLALLAADDSGMRTLLEDAHLPEVLTRFCVCADLRLHHPDVKGLRFANSEEDFEFLKLGLVTLCKYAASDAAVDAMASGRLVELLLSYLQPDFAAGAGEGAVAPASTTSGARRASSALPRRWTLPQFEELQLLSLSTLNALLPRLTAALVAQRGVTKLLTLLYWSLDNSHMADAHRHEEVHEFRGAGNAFHATGDFTHSRALGSSAVVINNGRRVYAYWSLRTLCTLARCEDTAACAAQQDLIDQGLLPRLQDYLRAVVPDEADAMFLKVRAEALRLCAALCKGRPAVQSLFGADGAAVLVPYLSCDPALMEGQAGRKQLQLAALDATWSCLVGCDLTESAFLELQGVFILLDVLERCPPDLHSLTLGILLDLCEGDAALQHALAWQGQTDVRLNVVHLLLTVWKQACTAIECGGVSPDGVVDTAMPTTSLGARWMPLTGALQRDALGTLLAAKAGTFDGDVMPELMEPGATARLLSRLPAPDASPALQDAMQNVRSKVHGMCCLIGFKRCYELVDAPDRLTLAGVEEYLNLKAGEVWQEIQAELAAEGTHVVEVSAWAGGTGLLVGCSHFA